jgi:hypothetical protein
MRIAILAAFLLALTVSARAAETSPAQTILDGAIQELFAEFPALKSNQLAATLVLLPEKQHAMRANYRGDQPIYPASVVKLFYLVAAHRWMEDDRIKDTPELRRAMRDMIVDSGNEPTHYVVDLLTDTTSGPELPEDEMKEWGEKRNAVNRYFRSLGYASINVNQKPWGEGPYGRERVWVGTNYHNRNALTTDATARLLVEIAGGLCVSGDRSRQMMELLKREFKPATKDDQELHRQRPSRRRETLVESRVDEHHPPRRRLRRIARRRKIRARHVHHRPQQQSRHYPFPDAANCRCTSARSESALTSTNYLNAADRPPASN